jgi:carbonic anhydrase
MIEVVYRYDPEAQAPTHRPGDAVAARQALVDGNRQFADLFRTEHSDDLRHVIAIGRSALGIPDSEGRPPTQSPFAVVLGCADARVPVELLFQRAANDLFVVRVAGNVLGDACMGSIEYAAAHLTDSVRLLVVLGHTGCGAVTATVDAFLEPGSYPYVAATPGLRAVLDRLFLAVRGAAMNLETVWGGKVVGRSGYRSALIETAVALNAAMTSATLRQELGDGNEVVFGVYDLATMRVGVPLPGQDGGGLADAPADAAGLKALGLGIARSDHVGELLDGS